jgi:hypothetical protein
MESTRVGYEFTQTVKILVTRTLDLKFIPSVVILKGGWIKVTAPMPATGTIGAQTATS